MDAFVSKSDLSKVLGMVSTVVDGKTPLKIFAQVILTADKSAEDYLHVDGFGSAQSITTKIKADNADFGRVIVFAKTLQEAITRMPAGDIELKSEGNNLIIKHTTDRIHCTIRATCTEDVPTQPTTAAVFSCTRPLAMLQKAIRSIIDLTSDDVNRLFLTGVFFEYKQKEGNENSEGKQKLQLVATNARALGFCNIGDCENELVLNNFAPTNGVIVPTKVLQTVLALQGKDEADSILIEIGNAYIAFTHGDTKIVGSLIDGFFPNYIKVVRKNEPSDFVATVKGGDLSRALSTALVFTDSDGKYKIDITPDTMTVSAESRQLGNSQATIDCHSNTTATIYFTVAHLQATVQQLNDEPDATINFHFIDSEIKAVNIDNGNPKVFSIIMPVSC